MKYLKTCLKPSLLLAAFVACGGAQARASVATDTFDLTKINDSLRTALTEFSSAPTSISSLMYSLDPAGTDISQDRYLFDVKLDLSRTPWSDGQLNASGTFALQTDLADQNEKGFSLAIDANYQTDALAMLKYKMTKTSHCDAPKKGAGIMNILWQRHCDYVAKLPEVTTIAQLQDLLAAMIAAHKADVTSYVHSLQLAQTQLSQNGVVASQVGSLLSHQATIAQHALDFLNGVVLQGTKDGFILDTPAFSGCPLLGSSGVRFTVSPDAVAVKGAVHLKFGKVLYTAEKPVLAEVLHGLERGDRDAIQLVKWKAQVFSDLITNAINAPQPQAE